MGLKNRYTAFALTVPLKHGEIGMLPCYPMNRMMPMKMPMKTPRSCLRLAALGLLAALAFPATGFAQYAWVDGKGVKQYSDRPPPSDVPASRILKQPGGVPKAAVEESAQTAEQAEPSASAVPKGPVTAFEKNVEFKKRQAEREEREKKSMEKEQLAQEMTKNCNRARDYQRSLDSGERIARLEKNGERVFLSDDQRSQEVRDNSRILEKCK
jgi:hypothetical protein